MAAYISEKFCIETENDLLEFFVNQREEVFIGCEYSNFFITITKEEWELLKKFLDNQFKSIENG